MLNNVILKKKKKKKKDLPASFVQLPNFFCDSKTSKVPYKFYVSNIPTQRIYSQYLRWDAMTAKCRGDLLDDCVL